MTPWLSVVIPTVGRPSLGRLLDSLDHQSNVDGVQVLLVGDSHGGETRELSAARTEAYQRGPRYRWLEFDGGQHAWGHPQRMEGMRQAVAPWIAFSQDDNILMPDAFTLIHDAIEATDTPRPLMFQVKTWQAGVVWRDPEIRHSNVDADGIVLPNDPERFGVWENVYEGDFHFISQTAARWQGNVGFQPGVIAIGRPSHQEEWMGR